MQLSNNNIETENSDPKKLLLQPKIGKIKSNLQTEAQYTE